MATLTYKIERSSWKSGIQRLAVVVGIRLYGAGKVVPVPHMRVLLLTIGSAGVNTVATLTSTAPEPRATLSGREIAMNRRVQGWRPST